MNTTFSNRKSVSRAVRPQPWLSLCITWILAFLQAILPIAPQISTAADLALAQSSMTLAVAKPSPEPKVTVNRTLPKLEPPPPDVTASENPTDSEIGNARFFTDPLVPQGKTTLQEN